MREILEDNVRLRDKTEARFQAFFDKELNRLKNDFRSEAEVSMVCRPGLCGLYFRAVLMSLRSCAAPCCLMTFSPCVSLFSVLL